MSDTKSHLAAFVRTETLPERAPPITDRGVIQWMRQNLFATLPNAILTILSLYVIYVVLSSALPWILNGVWDAENLAECRAILDGTRGACFAVLTERWPQLIYGLAYPSDSYWRPNLAFILMLGFFGGIIAAVIVWKIGGFLIPADANDNAWLEQVPSRDLGGYMLNMMLGLTCVSLSLPIGIALALGRQSSMPLIKWICVVFIEFIRGVPLITLLFVASVMLAYFFPPEATVDLFLRVVIMITMFSSAYIAAPFWRLPTGTASIGNFGALPHWCSLSCATASHNTHNGWSVVSQPTTAKREAFT